MLDAIVNKDMTLRNLVEFYRRIHGFTASSIVEAVEILRRMIADKESINFLSFTGNIVATGLRGLLAQMLRNKMFDVVITTCGTIDHDIARSFGGKYYKGRFDVDDEMLLENGIHRLGNIYIPIENYGQPAADIICANPGKSFRSCWIEF